MYDPVPLAPANTIEGALQRGRGWAARELLGRPTTLADVRLITDCIIHDARWDRQVESRARYHAELVVRLNVPLEPLARHVRVVADGPSRDDSDAWLARHVLELLAEQGLARAVAIVEQLPGDDELARPRSWPCMPSPAMDRWPCERCETPGVTATCTGCATASRS